jgi:WD40 repeat protein
MDTAGQRGPSLVATNVQLNYVQGHCFLPKSGALAYVTQQRSIAFLDPSDGRVLREFSTREPSDTSPWFLANICVSPDESKVAVVSTSATGIDIRDVATGKLLYSLAEEPGPVWWLAWSPDNQRLAVTRANGDIAVWNLPEIEAQLAELESGH